MIPPETGGIFVLYVEGILEEYRCYLIETVLLA